MNSRCILSKSLWHGQRKVRMLRVSLSLSLSLSVPLLPVPLGLFFFFFFSFLTCAWRLIGHDQYFIRSLKLPAPLEHRRASARIHLNTTDGFGSRSDASFVRININTDIDRLLLINNQETDRSRSRSLYHSFYIRF